MALTAAAALTQCVASGQARRIQNRHRSSLSHPWHPQAGGERFGPLAFMVPKRNSFPACSSPVAHSRELSFASMKRTSRFVDGQVDDWAGRVRRRWGGGAASSKHGTVCSVCLDPLGVVEAVFCQTPNQNIQIKMVHDQAPGGPQRYRNLLHAVRPRRARGCVRWKLHSGGSPVGMILLATAAASLLRRDFVSLGPSAGQVSLSATARPLWRIAFEQLHSQTARAQGCLFEWARAHLIPQMQSHPSRWGAFRASTALWGAFSAAWRLQCSREP